MKITRETDYALRIVAFLAKQEDKCGAKVISTELNIPQRFALKILGKLSLSEVLKSYKGNLGGYELNKSAKDITMLEIIEAMQGKVMITNCANKDNECCKDLCSCTLKKAFETANLALVKELSSYTFDKL